MIGVPKTSLETLRSKSKSGVIILLSISGFPNLIEFKDHCSLFDKVDGRREGDISEALRRGEERGDVREKLN